MGWRVDRALAAGVHGHLLVVKPCEAALMLGHLDRFKGTGAVPWHFNAQRSVLLQHRLGRLAVALTGSFLGLAVPGG